MLKILKFLYSSRLLMLRGCILSQLVVAHSLMQINSMQFLEW